jgi:hypothetical protein
MRGHTLIEVEDLVGLGATWRAVARQILKAAPLALVCRNKSVQIHAHTVFAAGTCRRGWPDTLNLSCRPGTSRSGGEA